MGFQQRPPRRSPRCPWCDQEMIPSADSRGGRLFCPNGEPVEYRLSGGRWYFNGRLNGLDEPVPPAPGAADDEDDVDGPAADAPMPPSRTSAVAAAQPPVAYEHPASSDASPADVADPADVGSADVADPADPLDAFRAIASAAWGADEAGDRDDEAD